MRCSAFPPCWLRCWNTRPSRRPTSHRSRRSARAAPRCRPRWCGYWKKSSARPFTIVFGQTECSPVAAQTRTTDSVEDKANTIGLPLPNMENKIIDPNTGETVPIGTVGEFCTRGYHVMLGYFEMPDATSAAIDADGWLHTGDLCAMDARGYLHRRASQGHDHPRRREHLSARAGGAPVQHPKVGKSP